MNIILIFDGDGVLFAGTTDIFARVFAESLRQYGISYAEAFRFMHDTTGQPIQKQYADILRLHSISADGSVIATLVQYFLDHSYTEIPGLCSDVVPSLELLKGLRMTTSTNRPQDALTKVVDKHGLRSYFGRWYGRGVIGLEGEAITDKRNHKGVIMRDFGVTEEEFQKCGLLVGDSPTDMRISREWGIIGIGRKTKNNTEQSLKEAGAVTVLNDLGELPNVIKTLF